MATILQPDKKQLEHVANILQKCQESIENMEQDLFNPNFQKSIYKANDTYFLVAQEVSQQLEQLKFPQYSKIINTIIQGQMNILKICLSQTYVTQEKVEKVAKDKLAIEIQKLQKKYDKQTLTLQQEIAKQLDDINKITKQNVELEEQNKKLLIQIQEIESHKNDLTKEFNRPKTPPTPPPPKEPSQILIPDENMNDSQNKIKYIIRQKEKLETFKIDFVNQINDLNEQLKSNNEEQIAQTALKIDQTIDKLNKSRYNHEEVIKETKVQSDGKTIEKYKNQVSQLKDQIAFMQNQIKSQSAIKPFEKEESKQIIVNQHQVVPIQVQEIAPTPVLKKEDSIDIIIKQQEEELMQKKLEKTKYVPKIQQSVPIRQKSLHTNELIEVPKQQRSDSAKKQNIGSLASIIGRQIKKNIGDGDVISQHEVSENMKEVGIQTEKDRMAREYIEMQSQMNQLNKQIQKLTADLDKAEKMNSKFEHDVHVKSNEIDQIKAENIKQIKHIQEKMKEKLTQSAQIVEKVKVETDTKATDTTEDRKDISNLKNLATKKEEVEAITQELDAGIADLDNFLKNRKHMNFQETQRSAENDLKNVLKELGKNKARAIDLEKEGQKLLSKEDHSLNVDLQRKNKIDELNEKVKQLSNELQQINEKKLFGMKTVECQTQGGRDIERFEALAKEYLAKKEKMALREKQMTDMENELFSLKNVLKTKIDELGTKNNKIFGMQKEIDTLKKSLKQSTNTPDKDKISDIDRKIILKLITENLELKIKLQSLIQDIKEIDKENKKMIGRFRLFIQNMPNLTDEQKNALLGRLDELNLDLAERFNMRELEKLSKIDEETMKSSIVKNVVGNSLDLIKQIKKKEKQNQVKRNQINYNPDFDLELLNENEEIQIRKVKKKVKKIDENGNEYEVEIEVEEQVVIDKNTGQVLRSRDMPLKAVQMSKETAAFLDNFGGMAIGGSKYNNLNKPKGPPGKQYNNVDDIISNAKDKKVYKDAYGKEINEFTLNEKIIDENGNEIEIQKKIKVFQNEKGQEVIEEEYVNKKGEKVKVQRTKFKNAQGQEVIEEKFINENGEEIKVQKIISKDKFGNEVIEEIQIDKFGNVKKTKVTKNAKGEEVVEDEFTNENGEKVKVQRIKKKDKDGNEFFEEITIDKNGKMMKKNIKMTKNEQGDTVMEEEFVNEKGEKVKVQKIVRKDSKGNEFVQEVTIDSKGNKVTKNIRKFVNEKGEKVEEEELINEKGEKVKVQRIIRKDKDGNKIVEETSIDANGNKVVTNQKSEVMVKDGKQQIITEKFNQNGKLLSKNEKLVKVERNKLTGEEIQYNEKSDLEYEERVTMVIDPKSGKMIQKIEKVNKYNMHTNKEVTKHKDADENEFISEKCVDEFGNEQIIEKKVFTNAKGEKVERIVDKKSGKVVERVAKIDKDGNEYIEETITDANGKKVIRVFKKGKDIYGNEIEEIEETDQYGNVTIKKNLITNDENGNKKVVTQVVDPKNPQNNQVIQKQYVEKDSEGNEVKIDEYMDANGKKIVQKTKLTKDKDGNEVKIIETIDENGNVKQQIQTYDKNGNVIMKEIVKDKNGKIIAQRQVETNRNGQVKEIELDKDGNHISQTINKLGSDNKQIQTTEIYELIMGDLEQNLKYLPGIDENKAKIILNAIHQFVKNGMPFYLDNDENRCEEVYRLAQKNIDKQKKNQKKLEEEDARLRRMQELLAERDAKKKALEDKLAKKNQQDLRNESDEDKMHRLYRFLIENKNSAEMLKSLSDLLGLPPDTHIDFEIFCKYMEMFKNKHTKCGENGVCMHLKRFFDKIGFNPGFTNREFLKMKDGKVHDFQKHPDSNEPINNRNDSQ